jgi:PAS domain-containing protein
MNDQRETQKALIQKLNAVKYAGSIINTVREPVIIPDHDLRVITASRSFYEFFKVNPKETQRQFIHDLGNNAKFEQEHCIYNAAVADAPSEIIPGERLSASCIKNSGGSFQSRPEWRTMMHPVRFKRGGI